MICGGDVEERSIAFSTMFPDRRTPERAGYQLLVDRVETSMATALVLDRVVEMLTSPSGEGWVQYMYLDTVSCVTVGYGTMLASADEAVGVAFIDPATKAAAADEAKRAAWRAVQAVSPRKTKINRKPSTYRPLTTLEISKAEGKRLLLDKLGTFETTLKSIFPDFDKYSNDVQVGLFDMIYNLGGPGLSNKFPSFVKAVKAHDWVKAGAESYRYQLSKQRNDQVQILFDNTAASHLNSAKKQAQHNDTILHHGSTGERVKALQVQLNRFAARRGVKTVDLDGQFGDSTRALVCQVQRFGGLKVDGWVGVKTQRLLAKF